MAYSGLVSEVDPALSLARTARARLAELVRRWECGEREWCVAEPMLRDVVEALGLLYAMEVQSASTRDACLAAFRSRIQEIASELPSDLKHELSTVTGEDPSRLSRSRSGAGGENEQSTRVRSVDAQAPATYLDVELSQGSRNNIFVGVTGNLSDGGIFVATDDFMSIGADITLRVRTEHGNIEVPSYVARVVDSSKHKGIGLRLRGATLSDYAPLMHLASVREPWTL